MDKIKSWQSALDIQKIDNYKPSQEFLNLIQDEIDGKINKTDIIKILNDKYNVKVSKNKVL